MFLFANEIVCEQMHLWIEVLLYLFELALFSDVGIHKYKLFI